jgi:hypothetical protein
MRKSIALLLFVTLPAVAGVYRWTDDKGVVHYSDNPPTPNAQPTELPKLQTFDSKAVAKGMPIDKPASSSADTAQPAKPADTNPVITSPTPDETFREDTSSVTVNVNAPPNVQLVYYLDGKPQNAPPTGSTSFLLENVDRGSHTVEVAAVDNAGKEVGRSKGVTFYMKQPTVNTGKKKGH